MGVLEGIRVLDLSRYIAGPLCTAILGDMGAEVIRVDRPGGSEDRALGPSTPRGDNMFYVMLSRNKLGVTLDLECEEGRELFRRLVAQCDVLVENFSPPIKEKLGLTYPSLTEIRPDIILVSISGFGSDGPSRARPAFDSIAQAECGVMSLSGFPDGPPMRLQISWVDMSTALFATIGTLLALMHRQRTGEGQVVDTALMDTAVAYVGYQGTAAEDQVMDLVRPRLGNAAYHAFSDTFSAQDGTVLLSVPNNALWRRLATLVERPDLADDPRFASDTLRYTNRTEICEVVQAWAGQRTVAQVLAEATKARIPCGRVNTVHEMLADPQVAAREMFTTLNVPGIGPVIHPRAAVQLSRTPGRIERPGPLPGQDNLQVYGNLLGLSEDDLEGLGTRGVI